jgi:hypothetical protein
MMRRALVRLSLVVGSLAVSCLVLEGVLRLGGARPKPSQGSLMREGSWSAPDPVLGWRNRTGAHPSTDPGHAVMTFGPDGSRASAPAPLPAWRPRVVVVGDSLTQGYGVADHETYVWRLGERFPELAFENLGVGAYGSVQALMRLEQRLARGRRPFRVFYGFIGDHTFRNVAEFPWVMALRDGEGRNVVPPHAVIEDGRVVRRPGRPIPHGPLEHRLVLASRLRHLWLRLGHGDRTRQQRPVTEHVVAEMAALSRAHGASFAVVSLHRTPAWLAGFTSEAGIAFVDCAEPDSLSDPVWRVGGKGHPSAARHALFARCIGDWLAPRL